MSAKPRELSVSSLGMSRYASASFVGIRSVGPSASPEPSASFLSRPVKEPVVSWLLDDGSGSRIGIPVAGREFGGVEL